MKKRFHITATSTATLILSLAALMFAAGPLDIQTTEADLEAVPQILTIDGKKFGPALPIVEFDGAFLVVSSYTFENQIVVELPVGTLPGDYLLKVIDSADSTRFDEQVITIAAAGPQKLEIRGAEPNLAAGTILISGANFGDATNIPADFDVRLFVPDPLMVNRGTNVPLAVTGFDPATQEIGALLPVGIFPGTFLLTVSQIGSNKADTLGVTLDDDLDLDSSNELTASVVLNGTSLDLTDAGGVISADLSSLLDDADPDPSNELSTSLALDGTTLQVTDAGGTLEADLSSLVNDADASPHFS